MSGLWSVHREGALDHIELQASLLEPLENCPEVFQGGGGMIRSLS